MAEAKGAAAKLIETVVRVPKIDSSSNKGQILDDFQGRIEFRSVEFTYPSRPESKIFNGFNLVVEEGQCVALVGSSGSGKSTVVSLVERFYDPDGGNVFLDNVEIRDLNLKWLRSQIGLVSQEPVLFATTIYENIKYGKEKATREEIIQAAKMANAHDFIMSFPDGYDTTVGEMGVQVCIKIFLRCGYHIFEDV